MGRYFHSEVDIKSPWHQVLAAFWQRYPNLYSAHVLTEDVLYRGVTPSNHLLSRRLLTKTNRLPGWAECIFLTHMARAVYVLEDSIVDLHTHTFTTKTWNLNHNTLMMVVERCSFEEDHSQPWTKLRRGACISSAVYGLARPIQEFGLARFKSNQDKAMKGLEYALSKIQKRLLTTAIAHGNSSWLACFHHDDAFKYRAYTFTYVLLFPVAFLCNVAAVAVFFLQSHRRNSASCVIMMNLALSDGSFSLTLPLRLAYYFMGGVWKFPDWLCRLCVYGFYVNLYTSILFLTLLSVLRWLAVSKPLRHRSLATPTRTSLVCLGVWLFVGVSSAPFLSHGVEMRDGLPRCFEPSSPSSWERVLILNYVAVVLGFLLPFLTIIICYSRLIQRLTVRSSIHGNSSSSSARRRNRRRSVHLVTMVTVTFLFCFLPYHVIRSLHLHAVCSKWSCGVLLALQRAVVVTLCLAASNSVVNPLLYYYSTRTFRNNMRDAHSSLLSSRGGSLRTGLSLRRRNTT
ncbi:Cysteinyl leukotriene receptor 1 [Larimichthys crocea]|uniref:Cysteinyl leukotriene receptor 1 n=1 Tax=Larimichthys crocea TaxID=215358 RepID=A0A6G0HKN6_LARCR|nr:Cysteinyl leukotriene receptor 1 [Larimichthys crocea]